MSKESLKNMLLAVISTLDSIELRTDQVQKSAQIHACSMKLSEVAAGLDQIGKEETSNESNNQQGE